MELIQTHAKSPPMDFACPATGCNQQFCYLGDFVKHLISLHKKKSHEIICECNESLDGWDSFREHQMNNKCNLLVAATLLQECAKMIASKQNMMEGRSATMPDWHAYFMQ